MAILFTDNTHRRDKIFALVKKYMAGSDVRLWPDVGHPDDIRYAIAWQPVPHSLQRLPNLKALFLTSAGVDAALSDPTLPDVSIIRCVNEALAGGMAEYVVYNVLRFQRGFDAYERQQREKIWQQNKGKAAHDCMVGIMGLGEMGTACIDALRPFGYGLRGWSRTVKGIDGVKCFAGTAALPDFLSGCDIVVCVLPLTEETRGILCRDTLRHLPPGAFLINAGRGGHMVPDDVLALLDNGHLAGAALDVFPEEPLPADSPFWAHPHVTLTPHIASITDYGALCADIQRQIAAFERGEPLQHRVDRTRGY